MGAEIFGQIDGAPVFEIAIATRAGASAKILTWGAVLRDLVSPDRAGPAACRSRVEHDRGLRGPFAAFRRRAGTLRQPHRQRPLHPRRRRASARPQAGREAHAAWRTQRLWPAVLEARRLRRLIGFIVAPVARRRRWLSRRSDGDLRLPHARTRDARGSSSPRSRTSRLSSTSPSTPISISTARRTFSITS